MELHSLTLRQQKVLLFVILGCLLALYLTQLTRFGIWYDEGIEYLFSKFMTGPLPDNVIANAEGSNNMYDRIVSTCQPPLYNIFMYIWLSISDSYISFRLAGVIVTFIGAIGFYKALKSVSSNYYCALIGLMSYLLLPCIMFYGLESAEYNLMLCFVSWGLYYFWESILGIETKVTKKNVVAFLIFASLAAYSQYGAILIMGLMYLILLTIFIIRKNMAIVRFTIAGVIVVIVLLGIPLILFFMLPQLEHQQTLVVSHTPVFVNNIFYSLWLGIRQLIEFIFHSSRFMPLATITFGIILIGSLLYGKYGNKNLLILLIAVAANYILYFILVAFSFYAYNAWDGHRGCYNLGGRYTLYMVPLILMALCYWVYLLYNNMIRHGRYRIVRNLFFFGAVSIYVLALIRTPFIWQKDKGEKEAYNAWIKAEGYNYYTLVANFQNPAFQFYYMHSDKYNPSTQGINVFGEGYWSRNSNLDEVYRHLDEMGVFSRDTVILVSSSVFGNTTKLKNHDEAMLRAGYHPVYILDNRSRERDLTSVVRYTKHPK